MATETETTVEQEMEGYDFFNQPDAGDAAPEAEATPDTEETPAEEPASEETVESTEETAEEPKEESEKPTEEAEPEVSRYPWMAQLKGETQKNEELMKALSGYKSIDELARAVSETKSEAPETPDAYELPDSYGERIDKDFDAFFKNAAFHTGLSPEKAQSLYHAYGAWFDNRFNEIMEGRKEAKAEAEKKLQKEYGGEYKQKMQSFKEAVIELGGEDISSLTKDFDLDNDARWIRALTKMGEQLGENPMVHGGISSPKEEPGITYGAAFKKAAQG